MSIPRDITIIIKLM